MAQYSWDYNPILSWLASLGYMVLVPNFAGSTGSGIDFMDKVLADGCGQADLADCIACASWFRTNAADDRLDLSRGVAVGGHSWGGYLAFMCMVKGKNAFSCGIATAGITDWKIQQRCTEVRYYDYALMGGWVYEDSVAQRATNASPITHAANLSAPLLVLHGGSDIDVPFSQIPTFVEAARRSLHPNASVEYHAYPGEGHGISGTAAQADFLSRVETFLRINLKPWDFTDNPHGDLTAY
jgi:dipeptidyl aminopeptidase/acylaminoacyl peptidase